MKKIESESFNIINDNISKITKIFPEILVEGKIDIDLLKEKLGIFSDSNDEKYQFTWNGKQNAKRYIQVTSCATLLPIKNKSVDWENTNNIYIEGDNLEVLKILQKAYHNKIKAIYIDPPYNTGNDFVYKDDYKETIKNYKKITEQENKANPETNGRFHTDWLNMIYPRLLLSMSLLTDDGILFISIDDNEQENLKKICEEIFGKANVDCIIWQKMDSQVDRNTNAKIINRYKEIHEYIILCYKNKRDTIFNKFMRKPEWKNKQTNPDNDPRGPWSSGIISYEEGHKNEDKTSDYYYSITTPSGKEITRQWFISKDEFYKLDTDNRIFYPKNGNGVPRIKTFENEEKEYSMESILRGVGTSSSAKDELETLFGNRNIFDTPKPTKLIKELIRVSTNENDFIMDFFSGSAASAEATLQLNAETNGNRKYIMIQLPEIISDESIKDYKTICDIGEERIRRAGKKIKEETNAKIDYGFKVFKLDTSNIKVWNSEDLTIDNANKYFYEHIDPIVEGRTDDDILYEILLKEGITLSSQIKEKNINNKKIYHLEDEKMVVCLQDKIDVGLVKEIGKLNPTIIIFKDSGFKDENAKVNALQELKKIGIDEEKIKSI